VIEPLQLSFEVACSPATAFSLWTERASTWWPVDHSASGQRGIKIVFEDHVGGRVYEITQSGSEHDWGKITAWEPPSLLAYSWHLHFAPNEATDVEIRFIDKGEGLTAVEITHDGWERLGEQGRQRREGNLAGWTSVYPHFVEAIQRGDR
jgi:uncharacterized protein YndB with AHSA1/START domain